LYYCNNPYLTLSTPIVPPSKTHKLEVEVALYAGLREAAGVGSVLRVAVAPAGGAAADVTAADVLAAVKAALAGNEAALAVLRTCLLAVGDACVPPEALATTRVRPRASLSLIPPVSGG